MLQPSLHVIGTSAPYYKSILKLALAIMAKRQQVEPTFVGGFESTLDLLAALVLTLGFIIAGVSIALFRLYGILPALGIILNSWVVWAILKSFAEIIRLLKRSSDIKYSGRISEAQPSAIYRCGNCGAILHSEMRCDACASSIETDALNSEL